MLSDAMRNEVDQIFAQWDRDDSPGCSLAIIREGETIYARGYGMANLEHSIPITPASIFDIGSVSKQFAVMSILLLDDAGKLSIDDDVRKHIPELPDYGSTITIRHLIHHTSGLRDYLALLHFAGWRTHDVCTEQDGVDIIVRQQGLNFAPGTQFRYSNSGYLLLSVIVERVSGQSLAEFADERIFRPLGMTQSHFHDDHTKIVRGRTQGYDDKDEGGFSISIPVNDLAGDGSLHTTTGDLALWHRNFATHEVGRAEVVSRMLEPGRLNDGTVLDYAGGLMLTPHRDFRAISHGGSDSGYRAHYLQLPEQGIAVICLCNLTSMQPSRLAQRVVDVLLGTPAETSEVSGSDVAISEADSAGRAGLYRNTSTGDLVRVQFDSGKLIADMGRTMNFVPIASDHFQSVDIPGMTIRFRSLAAGGGFEMTGGLSGGAPYVFEPVEEAAPGAVDLAAFEGTYFSQELDSTYRIVAEDDTLVVRRKKFSNSTYHSATADTFVSDGNRIEFTRDGQQVRGFTLNNHRATGMSFARTNDQ